MSRRFVSEHARPGGDIEVLWRGRKAPKPALVDELGTVLLAQIDAVLVDHAKPMPEIAQRKLDAYELGQLVRPGMHWISGQPI